MLISKLFNVEDMEIWDDDDDCEDFEEHIALKERLRRSFHYGKTPRMDRASLAMTELTVEYFQESVPRELGRVDMYWASSVSKKAAISPCAMMLGMLYIERLRHKRPDYIEQMSSEELFLISMMLASKYLYDEGVTEEVYNDEWAESANLDTDDINQLERDFLQAIDWNLFVSEDEFERLLVAMETGTALKQSGRLGDLTYCELCTLLSHHRFQQHQWTLLKEICKVFAVVSLAYTAGAMTMVTSPLALDLLQAELSTLRPSPFDSIPLSRLIEQLKPDAKADVSPCSMKTSNPTQTYDVQQPKKSLSPVSQFLTLTLIKDTVMAFLVSVDVGNTTGAPPRSADACSVGGSLHQTCHCANCPLKTASRRNKTNPSSKRHGRPSHNEWRKLNVKHGRSNHHHQPSVWNPGSCGGVHVRGELVHGELVHGARRCRADDGAKLLTCNRKLESLCSLLLLDRTILGNPFQTATGFSGFPVAV